MGSKEHPRVALREWEPTSSEAKRKNRSTSFIEIYGNLVIVFVTTVRILFHNMSIVCHANVIYIRPNIVTNLK